MGVWSDHKDFVYAGNEIIKESMDKNPLEDVAWDTSHFSRMPLLLNSFMSAQEDLESSELFERRKVQLGRQIESVVIQKNKNGYWVATMYMDGRNGVFRYDEETGRGVVGYDMSVTMLYGWWSAYTIRDQNPYFDADYAWDNGMYEILVKCAATL